MEEHNLWLAANRVSSSYRPTGNKRVRLLAADYTLAMRAPLAFHVASLWTTILMQPYLAGLNSR